MSKVLNEMFDQMKTAAQAVMPGLSLGKMGRDIVNEVDHQIGAGAHELAAALVGKHDAFVMYPRQDNAKDQAKEKENGLEM